MATILIIDDTPTNLGVMVGHLETQGYRVLVAQDGDEGLQRAELMRPDLILLDVMMPGPSGFEVCRRLKSRSSTHEIPVIFMTSLTETRDKVAAFAAGAVDYVTKPLQADEVMARIDTHLKLRVAQSQLEDQNTMLAMYREDLEDQVLERERAEEQIRRLNKQLEAKVAERTEQLSAANRELQAYPDLLAYARAGDGGVRAEAVALEPLVRQIVEAFAARIDTARATVEVRTPLAIPRGDAALIGQILASLLDNALNNHRPQVAPQIRVSATLDSGIVLLRVADNGIGITPADHTRVFEVFERSARTDEHSRSGVGLAIAAKCARLMGAEIALESATDQESTVTVSLPAARADSRQDR